VLAQVASPFLAAVTAAAAAPGPVDSELGTGLTSLSAGLTSLGAVRLPRAEKSAGVPLKLVDFVESGRRLAWGKANGCPWVANTCTVIARGTAVQLEPMQSTLKAPGTKRLTPYYDETHSHFAYKFDLRR
jgi:hypothetical protein